jgi:hypothetical protein
MSIRMASLGSVCLDGFSSLDQLDLPTRPGDQDPVTEADIAHLPPPATLYLTFLRVVGRPRDWSAGAIRRGGGWRRRLALCGVRTTLDLKGVLDTIAGWDPTQLNTDDFNRRSRATGSRNVHRRATPATATPRTRRPVRRTRPHRRDHSLTDQTEEQSTMIGPATCRTAARVPPRGRVGVHGRGDAQRGHECSTRGSHDGSIQ